MPSPVHADACLANEVTVLAQPVKSIKKLLDGGVCDIRRTTAAKTWLMLMTPCPDMG